MSNVKEEKTRLRKLLRERRASIPASQKALLDAAICRNIASLACFRFADTVLMYAPIGSEIDVTPLAAEALACGKRVAYPICDTDSCRMSFRYVNSISELDFGSYNIPEPSKSAEEFIGSERALCIVPALSFDRAGFRLGYGKGYYDRFLKSFRGSSLGATYEELLSESLPRGYYDRAVSVIVTERGSIITNAEKKESIADRR